MVSSADFLPTGLEAETTTVCGWGRTNPVTVQVVAPARVSQVQELVRCAPSGACIARGLGRAYGDAAQLKDGVVVSLSALEGVHLDSRRGVVTVGAGVSLDQVLRQVVPQGFFLPVTPGTRYVTVGGAVAADVHGKNHHVDGSFGNHVTRLLLVDGQGELRELRPDAGRKEDVALFWATVGGMGLTGVIVEVSFALIPIATSLISVDTTRYSSLDALMSAMVAADSRYRYSVAWVDSLDSKGRGVLTCGDHARLDQLSGTQRQDPLAYDPQALASAPLSLPGGLLNQWTVRAFNEAWFRKAPRQRQGELQPIAQFFHPLDGVKDWNRIYGPRGFLQYQFAVPDQAASLIPHVLGVLKRVGAPSFLTVLKRFGPANPSPLSFPMPGWTLAADVSAAVPGLFEALDQLDDLVASAGGRLYLAKDSRQSAASFQRMHSRFEEWRLAEERLDPRHIFASDLQRRTMGG